MVFAIFIHVCNFRVDGFFEMVWAVESLVCEALAFERLPASFDVVERLCGSHDWRGARAAGSRRFPRRVRSGDEVRPLHAFTF